MVGQSLFPCKKLAGIRQLIIQDQIDKAKKELKDTKVIDRLCQAEHHFLKGTIDLYQSDYIAARTSLGKALLIFRDLKSKAGITRAAHQLAISYIDHGVLDSTALFLDEALLYQNTLLETGLLYEVMDIRAMLYSRQGDHKQAMQLLKAALLKTNTTHKQEQISLLNQIATNYQVAGQIDSAIYYYQHLISLKKEETNYSGLLSDYNTLGGLHRELGHYKDAQTAFIEAIQYAELLKDTLSQVSIYINIANVYQDERLPALALEYVEKAALLAQTKGMLMSAGQCLSLEGDILEQQGQILLASQKYQEALDIYQQLGLSWQSANLFVKIANLTYDEITLTKAEKTLSEVIIQRQDAGDKLGLLDARLLLCEVLLKQDKSFEQVENWLNECQLWAQETLNTNDLKRVYFLKSIFYEKTGNYQLALHQFKLYASTQDSLLALENIREVRRLEKQYETVKKNKEIAEQQIILEKQSNVLNAKKNEVFILFISLIFTGALTILITYIYRRNRQMGIQKLRMLRKDREAEVLRAMISGEEKERLRIARDLHDSLGAMMATVKMRVSALADYFPGVNNTDHFQKAEELLDDAYNIVRKFSHSMVPGEIGKYGLEQAISNLCEALEASQRIQVSFIPYGLEELEAGIVENNTFRIVQELLQNIRKHAEAKEVIVQLTLEDEHLQIVVEDDGKGFDTKQMNLSSGMGMESIRSRVMIMNGKVEIISKPEDGTSITIDIPLHEHNNNLKHHA